jgi:Matrixin
MLEDMNRVLTIILLTAAVLVPVSVASAAALAASRTAHAHKIRSARASVTSRNPVSTAFAIAEGYWGAVPCAGQVRTIANRPLASGLDPTTHGWVTFGSSLGADNLNAPASTYTHCIISLAHWQWASWTEMESDWGMFCLTVIHETGHLLGHKHSLVPGSVMAPVFTSDANVPGVCNATWLAGWRSTG